MKMGKLINDKKGVLGLTTVKVVILAVGLIAILAIIFMAVIAPLTTTTETIPFEKGIVLAEKVTPSTAGTVLYINSTNPRYTRNLICTVINITNGSADLDLVAPGNYSIISPCLLSNSSQAGLVNKTWNITYSYTAALNTPYLMTNSSEYGLRSFFQQVPTIFILLAIAVLILIISIIIIAVSRFGGGTGINDTESEGGGGGISGIKDMFKVGINKGYSEGL